MVCLRPVMGILFALILACPYMAVGFAGEHAGPITARQAEEIALAQVGGGTVDGLSRHDIGSSQYYLLRILTDEGVYLIEVNEKDGKLLRLERKGGAKKKKDHNAENNIATANRINLEQAMEIALKKTNGGTVVKKEVERKRHGRVIYEFKIHNGNEIHDIEIDAEDGSVHKEKRKQKRVSGSNISHRQSVDPASGKGASGNTHPDARLDAAAAMALALEKTAGGYVAEYELDNEKERMIHEITIINAGTRYDVEIDDASGIFTGLSHK